MVSISGNGENTENIPEMQTYVKVAANLVNKYKDSTLFTNNLYTTYELHAYCRSVGIRTVGTLRTNNLPKELKPKWKLFKKRKVSELIGYSNDVAMMELPVEAYQMVLFIIYL